MSNSMWYFFIGFSAVIVLSISYIIGFLAGEEKIRKEMEQAIDEAESKRKEVEASVDSMSDADVDHALAEWMREHV